MGNRNSARNQNVKVFKQKGFAEKVAVDKARIGDGNCELWIHGRAKTYLMCVTSTVTKRKPKTKWEYDWTVEEYKKRFSEDEEPKLIAYSTEKTFQRAFTTAGKVIARKLTR